MKWNVITLFPEMIQQALSWGVIGKAFEKNLASLHLLNPRDFTTDVHKTVDDRPFGGGDGMVMLYEPLKKAMESSSISPTSLRIYLSPAGELLNDSLVRKIGEAPEVTLLCGRYGGVDQRFLNEFNFQSVSIGDYVVSGGEMPAALLIDAVMRKKPGVLGNHESAESDSFAKNLFFESALFTRPRENTAGKVPEVLLSGDHKKMEEFRYWLGMALTLQTRPELISESQKKQLLPYLQKYSMEDLTIMGLKPAFLKQLFGSADGH